MILRMESLQLAIKKKERKNINCVYSSVDFSGLRVASVSYTLKVKGTLSFLDEVI